MSGPAPASAADLDAFVALYDEALPHVYGYLLSRCTNRTLAEDLTADTFLAAVDAVRRVQPPTLSRAWLIGVARHKLADHWRRQARESARLKAVTTSGEETEDSWDQQLDRIVALDTLSRLAPQHRLVLTLRYVDDLPVPRVAELVGRSVHATEALLVRARRAFRRAYPGDQPADDPPPASRKEVR
ncbi:MAG: RNA polymerase sigma factor [Nocardioidaceae bacterium]